MSYNFKILYGNSQSKTVTPTTSLQDITPDAGYLLEKVTVSAIPTTAHNNPAVSINSSTGLITATHTQSDGYINAGTTTSTLSLSTQSATTITPTTSSQTAVDSGKYTTGKVTVEAIQTETKTATENGTIYPDSGYLLSSVTVSIPTYDGSVS